MVSAKFNARAIRFRHDLANHGNLPESVPRKDLQHRVEGCWRTGHEQAASVARENAPIDRFATPEEVADFYVFLCSDRASYSVGSAYFVDGGWLRTV